MKASSTIGASDKRRGSGSGSDSTAGITAQEASRLSAALDAPEGRRLLQEYLAARADPKARAEQDAYLRQLEREGAGAGDGKALVWPEAVGFVAKARRRRQRRGQGGQDGEEEEEKLFVNVVASERLPPPEVVDGGQEWNVPTALGPPRVEKDNGALLYACLGGDRSMHFPLCRALLDLTIHPSFLLSHPPLIQTNNSWSPLYHLRPLCQPPGGRAGAADRGVAAHADGHCPGCHREERGPAEGEGGEGGRAVADAGG